MASPSMSLRTRYRAGDVNQHRLNTVHIDREFHHAGVIDLTQRLPKRTGCTMGLYFVTTRREPLPGHLPRAKPFGTKRNMTWRNREIAQSPPALSQVGS